MNITIKLYDNPSLIHYEIEDFQEVGSFLSLFFSKELDYVWSEMYYPIDNVQWFAIE